MIDPAEFCNLLVGAGLLVGELVASDLSKYFLFFLSASGKFLREERETMCGKPFRYMHSASLFPLRKEAQGQ